MDAYLYFLFCVFMTLVTLLILGLTIYLAWNVIIEPILDRIKEQRDNYWEREYDKKCDEYDALLRKLGGLLPSTIDAIIPGTVETKVSHDNCEECEERVMITFTCDFSEYFKM